MAERSAYRVSDLTLNGLTFDADFDSGNCARVAAIAGIPEGYDVWTAADCAGTPLVCAAKTWFHFSVRGGAPGSWITITVNNMNGQGRLYKHDYRPVFRSGASGGWQRTRTPVTARGCKADDNFRITFRHRFECAQGEPTFFAFSYPWSYAEGQALLAELEAAYGGAGPGGEGAAGSAGAELGAGGIYFRRELLATSIEGRRVDLLTITAARGGPGGEPEPPAGGRPAFVLSARVHPGETPASHVLNGFLAFALRRDDPRARALREAFVLKVVPCLNPDGVFHGHYRLDTRGVNLNRCYTRPDARLHPAIHAARALLCGLHERGALRFHVDLHAHASKRGCFFYGNALPDARQQAECVLYAKLAALNCQTLDFDGCVFATPAARRGGESEGEASKEGASRVAIYRQTGATHCYTLECNYNMGRLVNRLAEPLHGRPLSPLPIAPGCVAPKYTPETWAEVGRALALAALDLSGFNPRSRLALAGGGSLEAVRGRCQSYARVQGRRQAAARPAGRGEGKGDGGGEGSSADGADDDDDDGSARHCAPRAEAGPPQRGERAQQPSARALGRSAHAAAAPTAAAAARAGQPHGLAVAAGQGFRAFRASVDSAPARAAPPSPSAARSSAAGRPTKVVARSERDCPGHGGAARALLAAAAVAATARTAEMRLADSFGASVPAVLICHRDVPALCVSSGPAAVAAPLKSAIPQPARAAPNASRRRWRQVADSC